MATLTPHPDREGWPLTLKQTFRRPVEVIRTVRTWYRYVYLNPLTVPVGFIGCTGGLSGLALTTIVAPFTPTEKRQHMIALALDSCLMAMMVNQSDAKYKNTQSVLDREEETETRPFADGQVTLEWHGPRPLAISYLLTSDGRAVIRLHHLAPPSGMPDGRSTWRRLLPSNWCSGRSIAALPTGRSGCPRRLSGPRSVTSYTPWFLSHGVRPTSSTRVHVEAPTVGQRSLEARFIRILLDHGLSVVTPEEDHLLLQREIHSALQGLVDDQTAVGPGRWLAPNILVIARIDHAPHGVSVTVEVLDVRDREVLAKVTIPAGPTEEAVAWDVALLRTTEAIRSLPTPKHSDRRSLVR
ncbi:MAG: hypothetical protein KGN30_14885 [Nitrospirota bacterium]|nr:hypothetical protein [Nitrospirota bacterium]